MGEVSQMAALAVRVPSLILGTTTPESVFVLQSRANNLITTVQKKNHIRNKGIGYWDITVLFCSILSS
jgi:hypothetical protein